MPSPGLRSLWLARKWFTIIPPLVCPVTFVFDAPFGRFAPSEDSILLVDGIKSWIAMELVSPVSFIYTFLKAPLAPSAPALSLHDPSTFLATLFLIHYANRALISPLRTPVRSKSHISVFLSAVSFNIVNGSLMGTYLSSAIAQSFLHDAFSKPLFWVGVGLWALGFAGNILHDEVLLNIRRNAKAKGKAKDDPRGMSKGAKPHYAVPHGYLYSLISYPNYFCEWVEWLGFALAAAPLPSFTSFGDLLATLTPPYIFFLSEVFLMLPRAYRGHKWYHNRFSDYPRDRKVVIPFLF
ncbi:hypothetical protein OBBRIDRAFT_813000 [Obba rivulosa]|uniref:3-oxo-5-alpha-steroid 4-dehydrogenase C-terminal domain-containing protein n=1 Tax=Obba rivulosa TaxID=1052685 RepID=A0A8E2DNH8_9APHY|nr:hypothetical protein OBBRIDRAFT_813000 [Obba rivulosa]